jgi:hypothetical protein
MECHDVRVLLTFAERRCELLDAEERAALDQHLDKCPDCASISQAERQADQIIGQLMVDVPVPSNLKGKLKHRLAAERPRKPWRWIAAAAAVLLLVSAGAVSMIDFRTELTAPDFHWVVVELTAETAEADLAARGLNVRVPAKFNYRLLQHVDVVEFKGHRVGKLTFAQFGGGASATVLILPHSQFHMNTETDFAEADIPGSTSIRIRHAPPADGDPRGDFIYVIFYRGNIASLERQLEV